MLLKGFVVLLLLINFPTVQAHVAHAEPAVEAGSIWHQIFLLHDWIHPLFFILMIFSIF